jgi:hypothetical protein
MTVTVNPIPQTREPLGHHTGQYQVTMTISTEAWLDAPEKTLEMLEIMFMKNNPIGKWTQIVIQQIDGVERI